MRQECSLWSASESSVRGTKKRLEVAAGMGAPDLCDLLGGPLADNGAASGPGLRTEIDYPIGPLDDVHMVLDDDDGVSGIYQTVENVDQNPYVVEVEASCGLV